MMRRGEREFRGKSKAGNDEGERKGETRGKGSNDKGEREGEGEDRKGKGDNQMSRLFFLVLLSS
jgi:hypothetical protein